MSKIALTPESLLRIFGSRGDVAPKYISASIVGAGYDNTVLPGGHPLIKRLAAMGIKTDVSSLRLAVKNYVSSVAKAISALLIEEHSSGHDEITEALSVFSFPPPPIVSDIFKPLYMDLAPRRVRHDAGEYYTPDWLADRVLELAGYDGDPATRLLDPSCGSGTFLARAIVRLRRKCKSSGIGRKETLGLILRDVAGLDSDAMAIEAAQTNYLLAVSDLLNESDSIVRVPVYRADSILAEKGDDLPAGSFDLAVGNPPWVNWESISEEYRRKTKPLWDYHGLFPHSGMDAILGKSKKDLSMLMTYRVMEKYVKPHGKLAFVITRTAVKSAGSGQGFRRFRLGDGVPIKPLAADDLSAVKPFGEAGAAPVIVVLKKGEAPKYPIPYTVWERKPESKSSAGWNSLEEAKSGATIAELAAEPVDSGDPTSPWITAAPKVLIGLRKILGASDYTAHAGVYSGGANGVFWLRILERRDDGSVLVENTPEGCKRSIEKTRTRIESDLIYPLLRANEVVPWRATPEIAVLISQDPKKRKGIDEREFRERFPLAWEYLKRYEKPLRSRAAWKRFFTVPTKNGVKENAPFYSMFSVGEYSFAPYKVVWRRMASKLEAAVIGSLDGKPIMPQETITFVPAQNMDEAHYLCALINSEPVNFAARAYSQVGGKGFASPHLLRYIKIPKYDPSIESHRMLARLGERMNGAEVRANSRDEYNALVMDALGAPNWERGTFEKIPVMRESIPDDEVFRSSG